MGRAGQDTFTLALNHCRSGWPSLGRGQRRAVGWPLQGGSAALRKPRALLFSQPHVLLSILHQSQTLLQVPGNEAQVSASPDRALLARCHQWLEGCPCACSSSQKELMVLVCVRGFGGLLEPGHPQGSHQGVRGLVGLLDPAKSSTPQGQLLVLVSP